ncbi:MAG: BON domain-containing protein [Bryobacteraceae bacterium]|jgi:hyperosmotically inducible protein
MKSGMWERSLMAAALLVCAGVADKTAAGTPATDNDLAAKVRHEILMYPRYTIWDNVTFRVADGTVELNGDVSQPYKKSDIEKIVRNLPGVANVKDAIEVLPLSTQDDRLRMLVARAIYGNANFTRYAMQAAPPIHIIVENGHVRLEGVVANQFDKDLAGVRASAAGMSFGPVVNNLQVEQPPAKKT